MKEHKTILSHLTNLQIKEEIEAIIATNKEIDGINYALLSIKAREIGIYLMNLTDESYIDEIIKIIEAHGIVKYDEGKIKNVLRDINNYSNSPKIRTVLKAKYFGIITQYIGFSFVANIDPTVPIPELFIEPKGIRIFSNLEELISSTCRKLEYSKQKEIEKLPNKEKKIALKKSINEKIDIKFKRNTRHLDEFIEYNEKKLNYAYDTVVSKKKIFKINPNPNIFKGNDDYYSNLFLYLLKESEIPPKTCCSTIYHYFKLNGYLSLNISQQKYIEFLKKDYNIEISKIYQMNYKTEGIVKNTFIILEKTFKIEYNKSH